MLQLEWYFVILIGTLIYVGLGALGVIVGPMVSARFIDQNTDKSLVRLMAITTAFCLWLFWICVYLSQVFPLVFPEKNDVSGL